MLWYSDAKLIDYTISEPCDNNAERDFNGGGTRDRDILITIYGEYFYLLAEEEICMHLLHEEVK